MSGRRGGNRIRGPQSALTDFLASNNISAAQIRDDYARRVAEAEQQANAGEGSSNANPSNALDEAAAAIEREAEKARKRKRDQDDAIEEIKKSKKSKSKKKAPSKKKGKKKDSGDEDSDADYDDAIALDIYRKSMPTPGQLEHCEICNKRFTVTPYSKSGPDGGLLCTPCGKELDKESKADKKAQAKKPAGRKRRKLESDRLDGLAVGGAKTLQQLCIQKVAQHHEDVDELGDMPFPILERLAEIFAKKRVLNSRTVKLFVRPDLDTIAIHDAAYLEVEDYKDMFAVAPNIEKLILRNACQFKDEALEYMMDRCDKLKSIQLYAANLVTNEMWHNLFKRYGPQLEDVKLQWLDAAFEDNTVQEMVEDCPNLKRVKLKLCKRIGETSIVPIAKLKNLEHLSLQSTQETSSDALVHLITSVGSNLRTLSLEKFIDADDTVLAAIRDSCTKLSKLRFAENDVATDAGYAALFQSWKNSPLHFADFNSTRDIDNNNSPGPEDAIGLASAGFKAFMAHSGSALVNLDISSCRHITLQAFLDVFGSGQIYPSLETINISFCSPVETSVVAGIFKSCPALKQVVAFGCFDILDVVVPRGIALIGVPKAQDAIEQFGVGLDVNEALGRMMEMESAAGVIEAAA
ncbi:hypothetical protein BDV97DRAFT_421359 [Delphinella strobiligena]|nr:hypothetical protein BDV97DRAFT_421359 [Delphinella strobiligena]